MGTMLHSQAISSTAHLRPGSPRPARAVASAGVLALLCALSPAGGSADPGPSTAKASKSQPLRPAGPPAPAPPMVDRPIRFDAERVALTREYIKQHYGLEVDSVEIVPKAVVIHWTATRSLEATWRAFNRVRARRARRYLLRGGAVNVSAHFLVDRKGTIYRLMPETWMARHCIGLNYDAIGIENLGGGKRWPLTRAQLEANVALVRYLRGKYPIRHVVGHMEWRRLQNLPIFRELDPTYRNSKADPGARFMTQLRRRLEALSREAGARPTGRDRTGSPGGPGGSAPSR